MARRLTEPVMKIAIADRVRVVYMVSSRDFLVGVIERLCISPQTSSHFLKEYKNLWQIFQCSLDMRSGVYGVGMKDSARGGTQAGKRKRASFW